MIYFLLFDPPKLTCTSFVRFLLDCNFVALKNSSHYQESWRINAGLKLISLIVLHPPLSPIASWSLDIEDGRSIKKFPRKCQRTSSEQIFCSFYPYKHQQTFFSYLIRFAHFRDFSCLLCYKLTHFNPKLITQVFEVCQIVYL